MIALRCLTHACHCHLKLGKTNFTSTQEGQD